MAVGVTRLISNPVLILQSETPHVVSYGLGMGSATVPVAVFGVAPKSRVHQPFPKFEK